MRKPTMLSTCAIMAAGFVLSANAVDWQFTGATNRTFAASSAAAIAGDFDSRVPNAVVRGGCNMRSDAVGVLIIFR